MLGTLGESQRKALEVYAEFGDNVSKVCELVGISRPTFYKWKKNKEFGYLLETLDKERTQLMIDREKENIEVAEKQLMNNIQNGKENSLFFYLKNRCPDRWSNDYIHGQKYIQQNKFTQFNFYTDKFADMDNEELMEKAAELTRGIKDGDRVERGESKSAIRPPSELVIEGERDDT